LPKENRIYAVRVRENGNKRTKFFRDCRSPSDASAKYKGTGDIMSARKMGIERLLGVGSFFKLGDDLLKEIRNEETAETAQLRNNHSREQKRVLKRRGYHGTEPRGNQRAEEST
jgi:hypothetical protein